MNKEEEDIKLLRSEKKRNTLMKIWFARIFGVIIGLSLLLSIVFVSYSLTDSAPVPLKKAIGINGTFPIYFLLSNLNNIPLYGFLLGCIIFTYLLVLSSLWFSCLFTLFLTHRRKGPALRSWCIMSLSYFCCSLACLKALGIRSGSGSSRNTRENPAGGDFNDDSGDKGYGSIGQGGNPWDVTSSISLITERGLTEDDSNIGKDGQGGNNQPGVGKTKKLTMVVKPTVVSPGIMDPERLAEKLIMRDKDEYNPFDTDSFKKREKHATFHGWGNQKREDPNSPNLAEDTSEGKSRFQTDENLPPKTTTTNKPISRTTSTTQEHKNNSNASLPNLALNNTQSSDHHSRSMDVFPREILYNPEYRTLLDTATRHIRLINNQKKKSQPKEMDIPDVTSIVPSNNKRDRDSDFDSSSDWEYDGTNSPSIGSEKDLLKGTVHEKK